VVVVVAVSGWTTILVYWDNVVDADADVDADTNDDVPIAATKIKINPRYKTTIRNDDVPFGKTIMEKILNQNIIVYLLYPTGLQSSCIRDGLVDRIPL
jgi:hypothetical protein